MSAREYYNPNEYKKVSEYKHFVSENYKTKEFELALKEYKATIEDSTSTSSFSSQTSKKTKKTNVLNKLKDKLTTTTQATTVTLTTVVAASVAVVGLGSGVIASNPDVELNFLDVGADYVQYDMSLDNLSEGVEYDISILGNGFNWTVDATSIENTNLVTGLKPNNTYQLSVTSSDEVTTTTHYKKSFYTTNESTPKAIYKFDAINEEGINKLAYEIYISDYYNLYSEYTFELSVDKNVLYQDNSLINNYFIGIIDDITPYKYDITIYGINGESKEVLSLTNYTYPGYEENSFPTEKCFSYNKVTLNELEITYDNEDASGNTYHQIIIPLNYDPSKCQDYFVEGYYDIYITTDGQRQLAYSGSEANPLVQIPSDAKNVEMELEFYLKKSNQTKLFETYTLDSLVDFTYQEITLKGMNLVSSYTYSIPFELSESVNKYDYIEFIVALDSSIDTITIDNPNEASEIFLSDISTTYSQITIKPVGYIKLKDNSYRQIEHDEVSYTITNQFELSEVRVSNTYQTLKLKFNTNMPSGYKVTVVDESLTPTEYDLGYVEVPLNGTTYKYYLVDSESNAVSAEEEITIDLNVTGVYEFDYSNPGDVLKTFNSDGTHNIYMNTNFATEDSAIYYEIEYYSDSGPSEFYHSREKIAQLLYLPGESYCLIYRVIKEVDGVLYELTEIVPSGTTGDTQLDYYVGGEIISNQDGNQINIHIYLDAFEVDFSNSFVKLDTGEVISLKESDFIYDESLYTYVATYNVSGVISNFDLQVSYNTHMTNYDIISNEIELIGSLYKTSIINITN